jgi:hypothetical protein
MNPLIGRAVAAGVGALAKRMGKKGAEEVVEEGGKNAGLSVASQATRNAKANKSDVVDEMLKIDRQIATKKDLATAQANPARKAAERAAETVEEGGVKTTKYPYVKPTPENMRRGGHVKAASNRGDGIAQRGKTRGKMR